MVLKGLVWRKSRAAVPFTVLWGRSVGRYPVCQHSGLHYFPSWGCRVVGGRGVPQPQQPQSLRDQVSRVAPEKQFRARVPGRGNDS